MAAAPRAAPASIDNATVTRVFMIPLHCLPNTNVRRARNLAWLARQAQSKKSRHAAIAFSYRPYVARRQRMAGFALSLRSLIRLAQDEESGCAAVKGEAEEDWGAMTHYEHLVQADHHLLIDTDLPPLDQPIPNDFNHLHFGGGQSEAEVTLKQRGGPYHVHARPL